MSWIYLILIFFSHTALSQEDLESIENEISADKVFKELADQAKLISLSAAIEEGLRKNNNENIRKYQFQLNELDYQDAFQDFWLPKLTLSMQTTEDHFSENLYRDDIENAQSSKTPTGFVGVGFEDYTLFNWGRDYLAFLNDKENYERNKQIFKEKRRELRLSIISEYFNLVRKNQIVLAYKKQLSHTSFIYRLAREKLGLRKVGSQEFLQAKAEFLNAHTKYQNALFDYYNQQQTLANLLGDDLKTVYKPSDQLKFKTISIKRSDAQKFIDKNRPDILQAKTNLENANRSYQKALKDNLPLPEFNLKLGTYQRGFSTGGMSDDYETFDGSRNVEVAATLNMTWTLYGSGGFFNSRVTERSYYQKRIAELNLKENYRKSHVANNLIHSRIQYLEKRYEAAAAQVKNARRVFDKAIDNYIAGKTRFGDMRDVLQVLIESTVEAENVKYEHLAEKVNYAVIMGLNDFPGDNFEALVEK